ncbi:MAG TPA: thiamine phosphate synthase [Pyrinomonadaceae bacterium]|nr:thiamine phosphate synthase [Pyrinomonadaceae bacterium]
MFFERKPLIYLITDGEMTAENFREKSVETLKIIEKAARAKISLIQIREKQLSARQVFELTSKAARITKNSETKLLVNDRADIAQAADADGVHLPANSLSAEIVRKNFPPDFIIGVSAHSLEEVEKAKLGKADFATFSPIFATASKLKYGAPQGIAALREVVETVVKFPVIALGGIDENNFSEVLNAGANGIAAIRLLNEAKKLAEIVDKIRDDENE